MSKAAIRFNLKHLRLKNKIENHILQPVSRYRLQESNKLPYPLSPRQIMLRIGHLFDHLLLRENEGAELPIGLKMFRSDYRSLDFL